MLVRTWNVFHGNAVPPERRAFLEDAVRLATADGPDVVCLQELPLWGLAQLSRWSGMSAIGAVGARPTLGPLPSTATIGRVLTDLHHGVLRSLFTGQAIAILLRRDVRVVTHRLLVLNPPSFRKREARRLGLDWVARLAWGKERRVCQVARVRRDGQTLVLSNLHATNYPDKRLAGRELHRAVTFVDGFAQPDEPVVFAGDFNLSMRNSSVLRGLIDDEWGFEGPSPHGIDHILVRGIAATPVGHWPLARRRVAGRVLSDHAPADRRLT